MNVVATDYYDPYSGTFPGSVEAVAEAQRAPSEHCAAAGLPWKPYDPGEREFPASEVG